MNDGRTALNVEPSVHNRMLIPKKVDQPTSNCRTAFEGPANTNQAVCYIMELLPVFPNQNTRIDGHLFLRWFEDGLHAYANASMFRFRHDLGALVLAFHSGTV